jgi:hypothetical protein
VVEHKHQCRVCGAAAVARVLRQEQPRTRRRHQRCVDCMQISNALRMQGLDLRLHLLARALVAHEALGDFGHVSQQGGGIVTKFTHQGDKKKTAYIWDSMDEEDRADTIDILKRLDEWVIWKSKDKWSASLTAAGFQQLLYIKKDIQVEFWGSKLKG